mgnify:CR=1 FL=1
MGRSMVSYVPLSKSALERSEGLEDWIRSRAGAAMETLAPSDWFLRGQGILGFDLDERGYTMPSYRAGTFLWVPPPAVALTAIEELRRSRHKWLFEQSPHFRVSALDDVPLVQTCIEGS